jgi:nucleoid DNA-binding protein
MASATTKRDLVKRIASETGVPRATVREVCQRFLDEIVEELSAGHRLEFRDFGVFEVVKRKSRVARNPRTGQTIQVPAKTVVHFKQGRVMKERVAGLAAGGAPGRSEAGPSALSASGGRAAAAGPGGGPDIA